MCHGGVSETASLNFKLEREGSAAATFNVCTVWKKGEF